MFFRTPSNRLELRGCVHGRPFGEVLDVLDRGVEDTLDCFGRVEGDVRRHYDARVLDDVVVRECGFERFFVRVKALDLGTSRTVQRRPELQEDIGCGAVQDVRGFDSDAQVLDGLQELRASQPIISRGATGWDPELSAGLGPERPDAVKVIAGMAGQHTQRRAVPLGPGDPGCGDVGELLGGESPAHEVPLCVRWS